MSGQPQMTLRRQHPVLAPPARTLSPCADCKRHIVDGMACPFCYADAQIAKALESKSEAMMGDAMGALARKAVEIDDKLRAVEARLSAAAPLAKAKLRRKRK